MSIRKKYVIVTLVILSLLWTGNVIYYEKHQLKEPLFLKHYYDIKCGNEFNLYYIENINATDEVTAISFPELKENLNYYINQGRYGSHYRLKTITINCFGNTMTQNSDLSNKTITKGKITMSSGKVIEVNLGKINLNADFNSYKGLKQIGVSASSGNTGTSVFSAEKDLKVTGIKGSLYENLNDALKISINGKDLNEKTFPISLKAGDSISISYCFEPKKNDFNAYSFYIDLLTEDINGKNDFACFFINHYYQSPEDYDIEALKKSRGWQ